MQRKLFLNIVGISTVGLSGYLVGTQIERYKKKSNGSINSELFTKPGLPIFATVSAATPIGDSTYSPTRVSQIMKYGFPGMDNIRSLDDYVLSYDRRNRVAHWVFEHLTKEHVKKNENVDRSLCEFTPDESIHPFFRSQNTDYKGSGFDRGHLAAAGNHRLSQKHVDQTFLLTNMAPQVGEGFNRHAWNNLERYVRKLTKHYDNVYCCTGPLYLPMRESDGKNYVKYQVIGANSVAVPTHFYKVVVGECSDGRLEMESYCMPNKAISNDIPVTSFQVPPETIERAAGLLFFDKIQRSKLSKINGRKV